VIPSCSRAFFLAVGRSLNGINWRQRNENKPTHWWRRLDRNQRPTDYENPAWICGVTKLSYSILILQPLTTVMVLPMVEAIRSVLIHGSLRFYYSRLHLGSPQFVDGRCTACRQSYASGTTIGPTSGNQSLYLGDGLIPSSSRPARIAFHTSASGLLASTRRIRALGKYREI
jgi:hypothetical protein